MSRSNGPGGPPPNRWPERPKAPAPQYPDQGYPQGYQGGYPADPPASYGAPAQPPPPQQHGFAPQTQHNQPPHHHPAYPPQQPVQPAYHYPDQGYAADSYSQPTLGTPAPHGGAPSYAPQFEPYVPPTAPPRQPPQSDPFAHAPSAPSWPSATHHADPYPPFEPVTQPTAPPHRQREPRIVSEPAFAAPPPQQPEWPPAPDLRGPTYDQQPQWPPAGGAHDPYAGYQPAAAHPQHGYAAEAQTWHHEAPQGDHGYAPHVQPPAGYGYGDGYPAQPGYAQQASYAQPGYEEPQTAPANSFGVPAPADQADDYDAEYEDEERSGRGRMMLIAAALVGAIGIGGGLAYGYKTFLGAGSSDGTPIVRSESQPAKVKPLDPGGKKFAHTDSKVLGRLNDGSSAPSSASSQAEDDGAPRKVTTMVVGRDGSIVPVASPPPGEASSAAPAPAAPAPASGVPGLTIVDGFGGRPPAATAPSPASRIAIPSAPVAPRAAPPSAPVAAPAVVNVKPMVPAAAARPTVIARAEPEQKLSDAEPDAVKPVAKKAVKKPVNDAYGSATTAAATAAAPAAASASGAGFVAVLASIPSSTNSRMEALKQFADLQQRYPSQLQSKSPEVQSANLAGKGNYDRLIVGPPGSRQQANTLCEQLKSAGYSGCWIKSY